jgi:low affinity Fe/Cu permease
MSTASKPGFPRRFRIALERFTYRVTEWVGSARAFVAALLVVLVWAATGPFFHFSDTWQLIINTGTTVVTFLMVFLIQRSQNKESLAVQLKLNEIVAALKGASNRLINVECLSEQEVREMHARYARLAELAQSGRRVTAPHSIDDGPGAPATGPAGEGRSPPGPAVGAPAAGARDNGVCPS